MMQENRLANIIFTKRLLRVASLLIFIGPIYSPCLTQCSKCCAWLVYCVSSAICVHSACCRAHALSLSFAKVIPAGLATPQTKSAPLNAFPLESSDCPAELTQPLRFTASFPWSPRQSERKHCRRQYKTKRERCLSKLNSFSFSFCTCGAACAHSALVIPAGFEPTTHRLEGCCSIQLSYGTILFVLQSQ